RAAELAAMPVSFEGTPCLIALIRDVTERNELQARLVQVDRTLAGGAFDIGETIARVTHLELRIEVTQKEDWVIVRVKDTGPAMREDQIALALAQRIIEACGGTITVLSTPGKGSEFEVRLACV